MSTMSKPAVVSIENTPEWDPFAGVERRCWTLTLESGVQCRKASRLALVVWAIEMGYPILDGVVPASVIRKAREEAIIT
jgi:hypothetical protein